MRRESVIICSPDNGDYEDVPLARLMDVWPVLYSAEGFAFLCVEFRWETSQERGAEGRDLPDFRAFFFWLVLLLW